MASDDGAIPDKAIHQRVEEAAAVTWLTYCLGAAQHVVAAV
eukprot:CAMPEP_0168413532 /NCGR_PEP_ID=MMETSP0228-20121227/29267_1 /TAXON_ID=133427 /ORGANISM="Protoceratium reticulatum, Strain CCCM 535 (=CCMP 1889)" /LENGTH=40 /DNA_ID= /DNA_START= /DNA_END= /DNA_ORIENTATION=